MIEVLENVPIYRTSKFKEDDKFDPMDGSKGFTIEIDKSNPVKWKARVHSDNPFYGRAKSRLARLHYVGGSVGPEESINYFMLRVNGLDVFFKYHKTRK